MERLIKQMMIEDPFYGFFLTTIERRYSTEVPTLAVCFDRKMNARLLVNREFFEKYDDKQKLALLKHEMLHLAFKHLMLSDSFRDQQLFNIAADIEVNSYVKNLPDGALLAEDFGLSPRQGTMYYYNKLAGNVSQQQGSNGTGASPGGPSQGTGNSSDTGLGGQSQQQQTPPPVQDNNPLKMPQGKGIIDDHSVWQKGTDSTERELANEMINSNILKAYDSVKSRGTVPGELASLIADLQKPLERVFDWKKMLRRFIGNAYDERKKSSRRKESRRFVGACGSKHIKRSRLLVGIDTSGSVSDYELREFFSELNYMYKAGTDIYVLECDARITKEYNYKPGEITQVSGRGGTRFDPVIDWYREHYKSFDSLIYFTDGGAPYDRLNVPQNNMLWVISSNGAQGNYPGKTLYIPKRNTNV